MKRIAIFASGAGSNALNLIENSLHYSNITISCLIVDTLTSPLPKICQERYPELPVYRILPDKQLPLPERKIQLENEILKILKEYKVEWILLAGYMRLVGSVLLDEYSNRIINIHPSLLPMYPGLNAFERAFADKNHSGITLHLVDHGLDTGPILKQKSFPILEGDTLSDFVQRGKEVEWELYPEILKLLNESADLLRGE